VFTIYLAKPDLVTGGPLGEAFQATVATSFDGVVRQVEWKYLEGYRYHTKTNEKRTPITTAQLKDFAEVNGGTYSPPKADGTIGSAEFKTKQGTIQILAIGAGDVVVQLK
jgi:hypothetical protein